MTHPVIDSGFVGDVGLVLDITGAIFLAQSIVLKRKEAVAKETASYFGGNLFSLRSAAISGVEA